jgi:DNA-binding LacI/PurR family transcriptional regulator
MSQKKRTTMADVAELAGVSIQTVSCVVNSKPGITDETRARVEMAIQELNYHPHTVARSLRTNQTQTIAIVVSDMANPSLGIMAGAAEDYAHRFGYSLVLYNTHDDLERERKYQNMAIENMVDGILFVTARGPLIDAVSTIPSVAIDRVPAEFHGLSVSLNNIEAGRIAAQHLLELGHTCFGHITGPLDIQLAAERRHGFEQAIREAGVSPGLVVVREGTWAVKSGYEQMKRILAHSPRPTAVFTANDRMAIGAMRAINEVGLRIPEDISIVGLDNIEETPFLTPPLTTIVNPFEELARLGTKHLIDALSGRDANHTDIVLEPELIIRESTGEPRR